MIIFYCIFIVVFIASPLIAKLLLLVLNLFLQDPIPCIDEIIMIVSTWRNISEVIVAWEEHKALVIIGGIVVILLVLWFIFS